MIDSDNVLLLRRRARLELRADETARAPERPQGRAQAS